MLFVTLNNFRNALLELALQTPTYFRIVFVLEMLPFNPRMKEISIFNIELFSERKNCRYHFCLCHFKIYATVALMAEFLVYLIIETESILNKPAFQTI